MGDYTTGQIIIYSIDRADVAAAIGVLENHGLTPDWNYNYEHKGRLLLCETYGVYEMRGDESEEIAAHLIENAPSASFETWSDPKYEWLGSYVAHTPELGAFYAECDAEGQPQFGYDQLVSLLQKQGDVTVREFLADTLPTVGGDAWRQAFRALRERNADVTIDALPEED